MKPARSPITPPPTAATTVFRSAPRSKQPLPERLGDLGRLGVLARLDDDHIDFDVLLAETFGHRYCVRPVHVVVGHQHDVLRLRPSGEEPARRGQIARGDFDIVASRTEVNAESFVGGGHVLLPIAGRHEASHFPRCWVEP